jgi:hypothetical protein
MKKLPLIIALIFMFSGVSIAADQVITVTIPSAKVTAALAGFLKIHPNDETDSAGKPRYTNKQWVDESMRRWFVQEAYRGNESIRIETGKTSRDDGMAVTAK